MIYRRQRIKLRQTTVEELELEVLVPLFATVEEQFDLALEASGKTRESWQFKEWTCEIADWHTIAHVDLKVPK